MIKDPLVIYTEEKLASLSVEQLATLSQNASRNNVSALVERCHNELKRQKKPKIMKTLAPRRPSGGIVAGYHFVCVNDRGVTDVDQDHFWTGSWVVAEANAEQSLRFGSYVALHASKVTPSYRQGQIVAWRKTRREMVDKENYGVEFLVCRTSEPLLWTGDGSGEKGYYRTRNTSESE